MAGLLNWMRRDPVLAMASAVWLYQQFLALSDAFGYPVPPAAQVVVTTIITGLLGLLTRGSTVALQKSDLLIETALVSPSDTKPKDLNAAVDAQIKVAEAKESAAKD